MTTKTQSKTKPAAQSQQQPMRGGLPDDAALDAFSIDSDAALAAFAPPTPKPAPSEAGQANATEDPGGGADASAPAAPSPAPIPAVPESVRPAGPAPAAPSRIGQQVEISHLPTVSTGNDPTQCTIMVQRQVRERFGRYQTSVKVQTGSEPTNAVVVRRAFLHAHKNELWSELREAVRHRQHPVREADDDPEGLFGEVPARRVDRGGVKHSVQQSFRPSPQELAVYDGYASAYGFDNRSDFLDAVLDAFLPELPTARRTVR
ncbi:hypothetical protein ACWD4T_00615 [Streptomyces umbrinus]